MNRKFNKTRYIELFQKDHYLESQNTTLSKENESEYYELLSYQVVLFHQVVYNRKEEYISLIEQAVTGEINYRSLIWPFIQLYNEDGDLAENLEKDFERLSHISIDSESGEFAKLIGLMFGYCEFLEDGMTESEFRACTEDIFVKLKKYSNN